MFAVNGPLEYQTFLFNKSLYPFWALKTNRFRGKNYIPFARPSQFIKLREPLQKRQRRLHAGSIFSL